MSRLSLMLFGSVESRRADGAPLTLPAKGQALLAYLALHPRQAPSRDKLAALLWGGMGNEQALRNLRHTVFTIRKVLGAEILPEGQPLRLEPGAVDVDVLAFER